MKVAGSVPVVDENGVLLAPSLDDIARSAQTEMTPEAIGSASPMGIGPCNPITGADNPHESKTGNAVSAHGWWRRGDCSGDTAAVRTCLLEWWKGNDGSSRWVTKKCVTKTVKPAKKNKRKPAVNARVGCTSSHYTGWANLVDVDVDGTWDNSEKGYKTANLWCRRVP